jgi:hypothetical protein
VRGLFRATDSNTRRAARVSSAQRSPLLFFIRFKFFHPHQYPWQPSASQILHRLFRILTGILTADSRCATLH